MSALLMPPPEPAVSIRVGESVHAKSSFVQFQSVPAPALNVADDIRERLDDATWIGRVRPDFSFRTNVEVGSPTLPEQTDAVSRNTPLRESHPAVFRFEVRVGDRVRFRMRPSSATATTTSSNVGSARFRLFDEHGVKLHEGQTTDAEIHWSGGRSTEAKLRYTFHEPGVYHLAVWSSQLHESDSTWQVPRPSLSLRISHVGLDLPDLIATSVAWDKETHGLRVEYEVADEIHPTPRPPSWGPGIAIYWVDWGCRRLGRIRHPVIDRHNADTRLTPGPHSLLIPRAAFPKPPSAATGIEFCLNGDRAVPERDPTNNVKFTGLSLGRSRSQGRPAETANIDID